jgi:adenosylhomocysteinase
VISIDATFLKYIETSLGTGEGFVRAMRKICLQMNEDYTKKKYLFFGYGKVGKGIIHRLLQEGLQKRQITVVDLNDRAVRAADANGLRVFNITHQYDRLRAIIHTFDCAVTCTGVNEAISRYFTMKDFLDVPMLINMGTYDEWGPQFPMVRVINNKKPLNYILEFPTPVCYLDPIYALMISASAHAFSRTPDEEFRVSKPPKRLQRKVLEQWLKANEPIKNTSWQVVEKLAGTTFEMA